MSKSSDWLPSGRNEQLAMARNWINLIGIHGMDWKIPPTIVTELRDLADIAADVLAEAMSANRTHTITAQCIAAFGKLTEFMRDIKKRYYFVPPLENHDLISLGLKPAADWSPIPGPSGTAGGKCELTVAHHLTVVWETIKASADPRSDHGVRIHYGVVVDKPDEQSTLTGKQYYLSEPPRTPELLKEDVFTRRKKKTISFPYEDSGKTAWFCLRFENSKGEAGPWGEMFSAVIP